MPINTTGHSQSFGGSYLELIPKGLREARQMLGFVPYPNLHGLVP